MEKKNNSLVIILMGIIIIILAVLCVLFATDTINLKSNESSNEANNQEVESQNDINNQSVENQNNNNQDTNIQNSDVDKEEVIYTVDNVNFEYKTDMEAEFNGVMDTEKYFNHKISINSNGNIIVTNKNTNETYNIKTIKNIKNILLMNYGTEYSATKYILLSNDGEVYYSKNISEISSFEEFETMFSKIENLKASEIGIARSELFHAGRFLAIKIDSAQQYIYEFFQNKLFEVK